MTRKSEFTYTGIDLLDTPISDRPYFCTFQIIHKPSSRVIGELIVNRSFNGKWIKTDNGDYHQICGVSQYSLPKTKVGLRKALRAIALENISAEIDQLPFAYLTEQAFSLDHRDDGSLVIVENPKFDAECITLENNSEFTTKRASLIEIMDALS